MQSFALKGIMELEQAPCSSPQDGLPAAYSITFMAICVAHGQAIADWTSQESIALLGLLWGWLNPAGVVPNHGIENHEDFSHTGD